MTARHIDHYLLLDGPPLVGLRAVQGLTVYTDPNQVTGVEAARVLRAFLDLGVGERLTWYTTSQLTEWRRMQGNELRDVLDALAQSQRAFGGGPRHLFSLTLSDDPGVPEHGFRYVEVDPARANRSGVLELSLPQEFPAGRLAELAGFIADSCGFYAGVGGFALRWNHLLKASAFTQAHALCRRYVGLDIQDTEPMSWLVRDGLPGCNWLTMLGAPLLDSAALTPDWQQPVGKLGTVEARKRGMLVRLGDEPDTGDLNQLVVPDAYVHLARLLAPAFVQKPPELWGEFTRAGDSEAWFLRLACLSDWCGN